ncbi:MAG: aspartate kinase [Thermoplasmata archaeon]|nr:aspartate kinase [Thermoplasmata archaeon]
MTLRHPVVVKFGGATLSSPARVIGWIRRRHDEEGPTVIVLSARAGVTDLLGSLLISPRARAAHARVLAHITDLHPGLSRVGRIHLARLHRLVQEMEGRGKISPPEGDRIVSQGERLSVYWLLPQLLAAGIPAVGVEADRLGIVTDNEYGASTILVARCAAPVRRTLKRWLRDGRVPVVTGFIGRSLQGRVTTLGRGGSDYTATALGAMLGASRVELVKRGVPVLTADPRWIPAARPIPRLSYVEAEELAQFGAKILHPLTVEPARDSNVEIRVVPLNDPGALTVIGPTSGPGGMRALTLLSPVCLLRIRVPGGRQRPGVVAEVSRRLTSAGVNIITLFTSSTLLSVVLESTRASDGRKALQPLVDRDRMVLEGPYKVGLLTAIGEGALRDVARLPLASLRRGEGLSATPRSVTLAVPVREARRTLVSMHRALVERRRA